MEFLNAAYHKLLDIPCTPPNLLKEELLPAKNNKRDGAPPLVQIAIGREGCTGILNYFLHSVL